jgi:integrase
LSQPSPPLQRPRGRPPLALGTHGPIRIDKLERPKGHKYRAQCWYRDLDGTTSRVSRYGRSKAHAEQRLQGELKARSGGGDERLSAASRFRDTADAWLADIALKVRRGVRRQTTLDDYRGHLKRYVLPLMGELRLYEINVPVLLRVMRQLAMQGLEANTLRQARNVIKCSLEVAAAHGAIQANPVQRGTLKIEGGPAEPRALTPQEHADLLAKLDADQYARRSDLPALVRWMLGTGCRVGEALAVRWCDLCSVEVPGGDRRPAVHINGNVVEIEGAGLARHPGKTKKANRVIPLPPYVVALLAQRHRVIADLVPDTQPIFASETGGYRWPGNVHRALRAATSRAGYGWVTWHTCRKTAATEMERLGWSVLQISNVLGHARVSMTQDVYFGRGQIDPGAADILEAAFGPKQLPPAAVSMDREVTDAVD